MNPKIYIQVMVNGEESLPKDGKYYCHIKGAGDVLFMGDMKFINPANKKVIDYYLLESYLQLSMPSEEEIIKIAKNKGFISKDNLNCSDEKKSKINTHIRRGFYYGGKWVKSQCKVIDLKDELYSNMQYYMEYCQRDGYITPKEWLENKKHF